MSIYVYLVALLFDGAGEVSFAYSLLPYLFSLLSTKNSESNNSTLVLKIDFHVPIVLAFVKVQILILDLQLNCSSI